jgi:pyruvate kinase
MQPQPINHRRHNPNPPGPASQSVATLRAMLRGGMALARINLTWCADHWHLHHTPSSTQTHDQQPNPNKPNPTQPKPTRGPLDFHRRTLANLQAATRAEQRLCGVIVGTAGREIPVVGRATCQLESGWWQHTDALEFVAGRRVTVTTREGARASGELLPIAFKEFKGEG